jgi:integrase
VSVQKRPNGTWRARILGPDGKERARHFPTRAAAKRWEAEQLAARERGQFIDPSNTATVTEYARAWAASRPHRTGTAQRTESMIAHHIEPTALGKRRLSAVRPSEVQAWATDRSTVLAPSTMRLLLALMRSVFNSAVLDRLVAISPVVRIQLPDYKPEEIVPLTPQQVRAFADAVPARCRAMIVAQAGLGLRLSEVLGLRAVDIRFLERVVKIEVQRDRHTMKLVAPKTARSRRSIPLPQVVADELAQHIATYPPAADGAIFTMDNGEPWKQNNVQRGVVLPGVEKAGLPPGTTSHDLRHAYAAWLLMAGESVIVVAERLGHADATMVLRTYSRIMPDQEDRTRKAIDRLWSQNADPKAI